jgi:hypothetical protein
MLKHTFLSVIGVSLLTLTIGVYFSSIMDKGQSLGFPWQVIKQADGSTSVFQIHLGKTTFGEVEKLFLESAKLSLFKPKNGDAVIEAYFDKVLIGGLSSKIIVSFAIEQTKIIAMYDRGARISTLGDGTRKVILGSADQRSMRGEIITGITYLPSINLDDELIEKRFGQPKQKITEKNNATVHWLYPEIGVNVALHENAKEVIMYVRPADFAKILDPLLSGSAE